MGRNHSRGGVAIAIALGYGVLASACADRALAPSAAPSNAVRANIVWTISKELSTDARAIEVQVGYNRAGGEFVKLADDSFPVALSSLQLPLTVDLSPCLSDPNRGAPPNVCPLIAFVSLKNATGATIATATAGPTDATRGGSLAVLTVAVDAVQAVSVTPLAPSIPVGSTTQLSATETDSAGTVLPGRVVIWTSSNPGVATVSATGVVTAVGLGVDTIRATSEDKVGMASVATTVRYVSVAPGRDHTCGLTNLGTVYCWGDDVSGTLGVGADSSLLGTILQQWLPNPGAVAGGHTFVQLTSGDFYSCALTSAGAAYCWGLNAQGQLGTGDTLPRSVPTAVTGGITFASLSGGGGVTVNGAGGTCGLTPAGAAYCWGSLHDTIAGIAQASLTPAAVPGGLTFTQLTSGEEHTCGLTTSGLTYCWGSNPSGQLGNGTRTASGPTPVLAAGGMVFAKITAGMFSTCGLTAAGAAYCWGGGELGNGSPSGSLVPVAVSGGLVFTNLNAGGGANTCGVAAGGAAYCWGGDNSGGGLGDGTTTFRTAPVAVLGGVVFTQAVPSRFRHSCGISTSGTLYCWGYNAFGQLGNGGYSMVTQDDHDSFVPVKVGGQP